MLAEAYGIKGYTITTKVDKAFSQALRSNKPAVLDCMVNKISVFY